MNQAKINELKQTLAIAHAAYEAKKAELTAAGFKSAERYAMLKDLKATEDAANTAYVSFTNGQIKKELNKIIKADQPRRQAEARERSAWKMAKYNAAQAAKSV